LVDRHQTVVRGWLRVRLSDWAAADDLAQDVFVTAFKRIQTYTGGGEFPGWLIGIARNHWRNYLRKHQAQPVGGSEALAALLDQHPFCPTANDQQLVEALRACLEPLAVPARELLEQRYISGRSVRELAGDTGRGYSSLTMQLHRLRESLATCIASKVSHQDTGL
jgi:RNA polymerase sigma-70 factor (ECF subfamily)